MPYIVCFFLIMLSFIFRKSKVVAVCDALFMWTLGAFNYYNPDYGTYVRAYNNFASANTIKLEIGFNLVCRFFNSLHLPYNYALGFMLGISMLLLYMFFIKMSSYPAMAMALYMIFCSSDSVQIRNLVMYSIVAYATCFICDSKERKTPLVRSAI
ncbi:MAG: EpsG family protein [Oscillibacter sp.]|nr:EpsG family protein [Oscillibacter sp.]